MDASAGFKEAIKSGDTQAVVRFIDQGIDLNVRCDPWTKIYHDGYFESFPTSPLEHAVIHSQAEVVDILIAHGANVNLEGGYEPALHRAVRNGNIEMVQKLIKAGADINMPTGGHFPYSVTTDFGYGSSYQSGSVAEKQEDEALVAGEMRWRDTTAFSKAVISNKFEIGRLLLANGAKLYPQCIYDAAVNGGLDILRLVLSHPSASHIDINAPAGKLGTPLQAAAIRKDVGEEFFSQLLDLGADIYAKEGDYPQPIVSIVARGLVDILTMVIDRDLIPHDYYIPLPAKFTLLHFAVCFRNQNILAHLLSNDYGRSSVNSQDDFGRTPLHLAALASGIAYIAADDALGGFAAQLSEAPPGGLQWHDGDSSIAKCLVEHGASGDILDFSGKTALEHSLRFQSVEFVRVILPVSPDHNIKGHEWKQLLRIIEPGVEVTNIKFTADMSKPTRSRLSFDINVEQEPTRFLHGSTPPPIQFPRDKERFLFLLGETRFFYRRRENMGLRCGWWRRKDNYEYVFEYMDMPGRMAVEQSLPEMGCLVCGFATPCPLLEAGSENDDERRLPSLRYTERIHGIQWLMIKFLKRDIVSKNDEQVPAASKDRNQSQGRTNTLESINFITTSDYTPGRIPRAAVFLFVPLIMAVKNEWTKSFEAANKKQSTVRSRILIKKGSDSRVIDILLQDALVWLQLEDAVQEQLRNFHELQACYNVDISSKTRETALHEKFHDDSEMARFNGAVESFTEFLNQQLNKIKSTSRELIELEFNLTSIREAQKSTSTSLSMKRLSWITFVYLPLTFVASLFGMNVDILESNPPWWTYLPFAVGTLGLTIIAWSIFKYTIDEKHKTERDGTLTAQAGRARMLLFSKMRNP